MTRKNVDDVLELQKTDSLQMGSLHATPTPPYYLSLGTDESVIKQLEMGGSLTTATEKERPIHGSLEIVSYPTSAWVFVELLTFK